MNSVSFQRSSLAGTRVQSAPRRAPAPFRAVQLDEQAKTVEQSAAPSGDRAIIGQKAQPTGAKANEEPPSENMGATGSKEKRQSNDGYDDDVATSGGRPS
ncbi:hypothetical protein WJX81_003776 [Elliptochloris bilobata]|uniref:Uncharacterized protein n=1 Tax=Elliptochloris bilobata TaxID=381761 RepID=A0AAW1QMT3_9CHLO